MKKHLFTFIVLFEIIVLCIIPGGIKMMFCFNSLGTDIEFESKEHCHCSHENTSEDDYEVTENNCEDLFLDSQIGTHFKEENNLENNILLEKINFLILTDKLPYSERKIIFFTSRNNSFFTPLLC